MVVIGSSFGSFGGLKAMKQSAVKVAPHTPPPQLSTKLSGPQFVCLCVCACVCFDSATTHKADICIMTAVAPALSTARALRISF